MDLFGTQSQEEFGIHEYPVISENHLYPTHTPKCVNVHIRRLTNISFNLTDLQS